MFLEAQPTLDQSDAVCGDQNGVRADHSSRAGPMTLCPGLGPEKTLGILANGSQLRLRAEHTPAQLASGAAGLVQVALRGVLAPKGASGVPSLSRRLHLAMWAVGKEPGQKGKTTKQSKTTASLGAGSQKHA